MDTERHPCFGTFRRAPPCNPATPFEKGVDPKTLSADGQHTFYGRAKNPVCRSRFSLGTDLWTPVAVPSVGVLCSRAWWEASSESPWVFGRCLPPARPEKAKPFQAGRSPCTKHPQIVRLRLHEPKKVFEESKGRFSKNAPLAGCGTASHKERRDITLSAFHSALYRDLPQWNSLYGK